MLCFRLAATTYIIIYQFQVVLSQKDWEGMAPMRYVDYNVSYNDFFFDRIVPIVFDQPNYRGCVADGMRLITTGILISSDQILTAYNPFREYSRSADMKRNIVTSIMYGRHKIPNVERVFYYNYIGRILCGRQVVFLPDTEIAKDQWHGLDRKFSPLHDLMVLRVDSKFSKVFSKLKPHEHTYARFPENRDSNFLPGVFLTEIAGPDENLNKTIKFCSLGHERPHEYESCRNLHATQYEPDENAVVDCDRWLPRNWGYFICILNIKNHKTLGSGAMLVSNNKVFGVGSFVLFKNKKSVLVFTDVRPYYDLIYKTCTVDDVK